MSETLVQVQVLEPCMGRMHERPKDHGQWEIQPPVSRYRYIGRDVHVQ